MRTRNDLDIHKERFMDSASLHQNHIWINYCARLNDKLSIIWHIIISQSACLCIHHTKSSTYALITLFWPVQPSGNHPQHCPPKPQCWPILLAQTRYITLVKSSEGCPSPAQGCEFNLIIELPIISANLE